MFNFLHQQLSLIDAMALDRLAQEAACPGMKAIELGSFTGRSSLAVLPTVKQHGGSMVCVDWFQGNEGLGDDLPLSQGYAQANVLDVLRQNLRAGGYEDLVTVMVGTTQSVAPSVQDGCADLLFVDADHRYTGVRQDIIDWYPKLKEGGIICGHDMERRLDECDLARVEAHCEVDLADGLHYGVIRAVGEFFPDAQLEGVVWWVRKKAGAYPELEAAIAEARAPKPLPEVAPEVGAVPILTEFLDGLPAGELFAQSLMALHSGDVLNAMRGAKALTRRFPQTVEGWKLAYQICLETQNEEAGEGLLKQALEHVGKHPELLNLLGVHLHKNGDMEGAKLALHTAMLASQNTILNLAYTLADSGQKAQALDYFKVAIHQNPMDIDAHLGLAQMARALRLDELFLEALRQAKDIDPQSLVVARLEQEAQALREKAPAR